jgi:aspartyl-tRNA(Asn)/glutamyl-tRNA(Gln) amidotransferase subunit A
MARRKPGQLGYASAALPSSAEDLAFASIELLAKLIRRRKISPVDLIDATLARIARLSPRLNCYITVLAGEARAEAARAARNISRGNWLGPLHGIPITIKDNIWTRGVRTTVGSKILSDFVPEEDATLIARLRSAGAIILGKTNLHEFAYGITSNNPHFGPVRNPWDLNRIPGGSSGGSAAAVAAGLCSAAIGTDTGGSIRIPSACCGVVGLKPAFGRVSCYGVVPLARSLDHAGPITRTAEDAAILLHAISGFDPRDETSAREAVQHFARALRRLPRRVRIGWPRDFFFDRVDDEVLRAVRVAREVFEKLGAEFRDVSLPSLPGAHHPAVQISLAEATQYHRSAGYFPARAAEYGEDVRARLETGNHVTASDYLDAFEVRKRVQREFAAAFEETAAIFAPTLPVVAPPIGDDSVLVGSESEDVRNALVRLNRPGNLTGLPAISIPCGFTSKGLPIGVQMIGPAFGEVCVLQLAAAYQRRTNWHTRRPPLA